MNHYTQFVFQENEFEIVIYKELVNFLQTNVLNEMIVIIPWTTTALYQLCLCPYCTIATLIDIK